MPKFPIDAIHAKAHRRLHGDQTFAMSDLVRAAHSRIRRHPRFPFNDHTNIDPTLAYPRSRLLSDLSEPPDPGSASKVFILNENEVGLPGVRMFVRSEEQPYLRGAINALECLIERHGLETLKKCGVVAQERSPHAEDVAIAASAYGIPTYVGDLRDTETGAGTTRRVSKVVLSVEQLHIDGQMSPVMTREAPVPFPLHHHAEVVHGNGTIGLQLEQEMASAASQGPDLLGGDAPQFDAILADIGNGCTLSGVCMAFLGKSTQVFGAAPSSGFWEHAASLRQTETPIPQQSKFEYWKDLEIPIGDVPWSVFTSSGGLSGVFDVNDEAMAAASLKVFERSGLHLHPDEVVPLAVALYNQDFRQIIARKLRHGRSLTIGVVLQPRKSTLTGHVSQLGAEAMASGSFQ